MDGHGFESSDGVRDDDVEEGVAGRQVFVPLQLHVDRGGSRATEVYEGLIDVFAIEIGPQG